MSPPQLWGQLWLALASSFSCLWWGTNSVSLPSSEDAAKAHVLTGYFESKLVTSLGRKLLEVFESVIAVGSSCQALIRSFGNARLISYTEFVGLWGYLKDVVKPVF